MNSVQNVKEGFLQVSPLHSIYYATFGNPYGVPLLCFHGGPGGDFKIKYSLLADQDKYYTILFNQRGCGKSVPGGELQDNTPEAAVTDAKKLLDFLQITRCYVTGFSYGSSLAMLFAIKNPTVVKALFLSSVFVPNNFDNRFYGETAKNKSPLGYKAFISTIKCTNSADLLHKITVSTKEEQEKIIRAFIDWEIQLFKGRDTVQYSYPTTIDQALVDSKRILLHYAANDYFGLRDLLLDNLSILDKKPIMIVHGDSDYLTPITTAYELQEKLPQIKIFPVVNGGHVGSRVTQKLYEVINCYLENQK